MLPLKFQVYDHKQKMMFDVVEILQLNNSEGFVKGRKGDSGGEYFVAEGYLNKKFALSDGKQIYRFSLRRPTGLKDKNGKEIYEGDIVEVNYRGGEVDRFKVYYETDRARYSFEDEQGRDWGFAKSNEMTVIGNIYEHPHLLEARSAPESNESAQGVSPEAGNGS